MHAPGKSRPGCLLFHRQIGQTVVHADKEEIAQVESRAAESVEGISSAIEANRRRRATSRQVVPDVTLGTVSYHLRTLDKAGVTEAEEPARRGYVVGGENAAEAVRRLNLC